MTRGRALPLHPSLFLTCRDAADRARNPTKIVTFPHKVLPHGADNSHIQRHQSLSARASTREIMLNRMKVVTSLLLVLVLFGALQLISGGLFSPR